MFYALAHGKIPLDGFEIEHVVEDIESLNHRALGVEAGSPRPKQGEDTSSSAAEPRTSPLHVTALSCHTFALVSDRYELIPYGASVGDGYGPVLIAREKHSKPAAIRGKKVAVPGRYTTAYLALQIYESGFTPVFTPFDKIFDAVEKGEADFGLLIHEGQLTYREKGFEKILDLGEWWQTEFSLPLPLGINAIRRDLGEDITGRFNGLFKKSIDYAMEHRKEAVDYALKFGRGIDAERGDQFVGMYVNDYSLDLGEKGRKGLEVLFEQGWKKKILPHRVEIILPRRQAGGALARS